MTYLHTFFTNLLLLTVCFSSMAQPSSIRFNEVVSSNSTHFDEDSDTPDWIELFNVGSQTVNLENWSLTDNLEEPEKWPFPSQTIVSNEYLLVWASGKDKRHIGSPRTLVSRGDVFRYIIPTATLPSQWTAVGFVDLTWQQGTTGLGYGDNDDATLIPYSTTSVYMRRNFTIENPQIIQSLVLDIDYDDSFVAYLNGTEIARANIEGNPPPFYATAITDREAVMYQGGRPDRFLIENPQDLLQSGTNVLSIQVHNHSTSSSDMSIIPYLTAFYTSPTAEGTPPPSALSLDERNLHTNFKISSEGETLYLFNANKELEDSIRIETMQPDISLGIPLGINGLYYFDQPTPGLPNTTDAYVDVNRADIEFSHLGGETSPLSLSLSGIEEPAVIRYTTDATIPTENSPIYSNSIPITSNTVIRARVFQENHIPSTTQSHTYLVNQSHDLPIVTLVTEPDNFFDEDDGMYVLGNNHQSNFPYFGANFWEDWERPVHFSFYETNGNLGLAFDGGTKIFGGWSRGNEQRSLSIFARNQYGLGEIDYPLFPSLDYTQFQAFVLRNSGSDWNNTMLRDALLTGLMKDSGLEYQAYRPAAAYINGEYWGIYNIREKINEHFLASKHGISPDEIDLLEFNAQIIHGDNEDYLELRDFVNSNSLFSTENYQYVADRVDIQNFIAYQTAQIYFNNTDWPGNNIKYWKAEGGKWRWILFDTDFGFGTWNVFDYFNNTLAFALESNGPGWPNPPWSTLLFRKLTENIGFRNAFINHFADQLNSRFLRENVVEHIDTFTTPIVSELPRHFNRWQGENYWTTQIDNMKVFANQRSYWTKQHILEEFNLPATHQLTLQNHNLPQGYIRVNSLTIKENNWQGDYFENVPIQVTAIPQKGFVFSHWSGANVPNTEQITVNMKSTVTLTPHFEKSQDNQEIVINEINYNSHENFDTGDWIELFNPATTAVNLSNWMLKDNDDSHTFTLPEGTQIERKGFLVLTRDKARFQEHHPNMNMDNVIGDFDFGLSSNGDAVRLFDSEMVLRDEVHYLPDAPWATEANGTGATLELLNPSFDNSLPENWASLNEYGSPNEENQEGVNIEAPLLLENLRYYPNPFNDRLHLDFLLKRKTHFKANLYHIDGSLAHPIFEGNLGVGAHQLKANVEALQKGMYLLQLEEGGKNVRVLKWVKI